MSHKEVDQDENTANMVSRPYQNRISLLFYDLQKLHFHVINHLLANLMYASHAHRQKHWPKCEDEELHIHVLVL